MSDQSSTPSSPARPNAQVVFDHERLDVYQEAVRLLVTADTLVEQLPPGRAYLADQLHRASLSIVLNIAEGAGEFSPSEKARFYRMALRSATECAAIVDASRALGVTDEPTATLARQQLFAIVRMLSRMVQNLKTRTPRKPRRNQVE